MTATIDEKVLDSYYDQEVLDGAVMFGLRVPDMTPRQRDSLLCYLLKIYTTKVSDICFEDQLARRRKMTTSDPA